LKPIRVALETQFTVGTPTGLGVYARGLSHCLQAREDVQVVELCDPRFDLWRFDRRVYWDQIRAPSLAARADADVVHYTGGTLPVFAHRPTVLTLHDLVWLRGVDRGRFYVRWYYGGIQPALARRADALVVDTHVARQDVADGLRIDPARIDVVGIGVDERFFSLQRSPSDPPFALCVGTVERRKDIATAVRALAHVPHLRLVSVGPITRYADEVCQIAAECGVSDRVELRGYVDDATLRDLYAHAALLAFPSRYEGFGLPPVQALACGLPVAAARIPVVVEVLGDCAAYAAPGDPASFAQACELILGGNTGGMVERGRARAGNFAWGSVGERMMSVYRRVAGR
jgi:glycosyltransferase involved in cell wall biosynthesis